MTAISTLAPQPAAPDAASIQHKKLVDAAQQFEAMFLNEMLKSSFGDGDDSDSDTVESQGQNGTMQSFGVESVSKAISQAGGFGIARHIVAEVEQEHARREATEKVQTTLKSL